MQKWILGVALIAACGDDGGKMLPACEIHVSGDVFASDTCRMFLCYPRNADYQALLLSNLTTPRFPFQISVDVTTPTVFGAGTLTLDQMRSTSQLNVTLDDTTYAARQAPATGAARTADETATLEIADVIPPSGAEDVCNGSVVGTLTASLVEVIGLHTVDESIGPGRAMLTVQLGL